MARRRRGLRLGVDLVHVPRLARVFAGARSPHLSEVFAPSELAACATRARPFEGFAARFAAKEAFLKAVQARPDDGIRLREVSVELDASGVPWLRVRGAAARLLRRRGCRATAVSLAHHGDYAVACCVAW